MTKTQLIATVAGLGLQVDDKDTKEVLLEKAATHYAENGMQDELVAFLEENGYELDEEGNAVKRAKKRSLGENPNTKAYHTIKALQDESLAHLTYAEIVSYLKETVGMETTSRSVAWYANWLKTKGKPVVARAKKAKEEEEEVASVEENGEAIPEENL